MKRYLTGFAIALLHVIIARGQAAGYDVSLIPDSLKQNANAVARESTGEFTFYSPGKTSFRVHEVITVLNKNGDWRVSFEQPYDKFRSIEFIKGSLYDAGGKLIRKIKESDLTDLPGAIGNPEFEDVRYKKFNPLQSVYPFTLEIEYIINYKGSYVFPGWLAFEGYNVSAENTTFIARVPSGYKLNLKEVNIPSNLLKTEDDGKTLTYSWTWRNILAIDREPFQDDLSLALPRVYISPSGFSYGGYEGNMNSWKELGAWFIEINAGRDELLPSRVNEIRKMVEGIDDDREKVRRLYSYMQQRTRYFSIQLGIGGLQPMDAKTVDETGYSDCKGLSNYMKAILNAAGIKSYYTLVQAGDDFPIVFTGIVNDPFNHVILCVPLKNDTIWLECTNQNKPFNFLGSFTSDRHVLLIKEEGGELVKTPSIPPEDNFQYTRAIVKITREGNGRADITREFGGLQFDETMYLIHAGAEKQKRWLYNYLPIPDFRLATFDFHGDPAGKPESVLKIAIDLNNYASSSGKRVFLPLNLANASVNNPARVKNRRSDIRCKISYVDIDTVEYELPGGLEADILPADIRISSPFGEYMASARKKGNSILYTREVRRYKGIFPREMYDDFIRFNNDIRVADKSQAVLVKKEGLAAVR